MGQIRQTGRPRALRARQRASIRLTGSFDDKDVTGTGGVVAAVALVPLAGSFVTGTSALSPKGGAVGGFIDEDVELAFDSAAAPPLQIPIPAAPITVP